MYKAKEYYYDTLGASSQRGYKAKHEPSLLINLLLYTLKLAYGEFERRVGQTASHKGAKAEMIETA